MIHYLTHPEVVIDPTTPIPRWHLAPEGIARARAAARALPRPAAIWSSTECKAIETAGLIAAHHALPIHLHPGLDENDRSSTGYLPPDRFQHAADEFFAHPGQSHEGWERAADAQSRVLAAWHDILAQSPGPLIILGHGGTGTLLWCALTNHPIDRRHDTRRQGQYWTHNRATSETSAGWRPLEALCLGEGVG